jgi:hypothetical protein
MEDLANFIWIGGAIAELGPRGFLKLWKLLQPALWHYMYNRRGSEEDMHDAAHSLRSYAEEMERFVMQGKVRSIRLWVFRRAMLSRRVI